MTKKHLKNMFIAHACDNGCYQQDRTNKRWRGGGEKGTLTHGCWACNLVQPPWGTGWSFLRKLGMALP